MKHLPETFSRRPFLRFLALLFVLLLTGCASFGNIQNVPASPDAADNRYSISNSFSQQRSGDVTLVLAFSGGGTRAAALAYGVLEALRDTTVVLDGQPRRLLDEIDVISAVSGGSFTAAYFGLHGDGLFKKFEKKFLRHNVAGELLYGLLDPTLWFSSQGRTEMAVRYYENRIFKGATYADMQRRDGPLIVLNATDLGKGVRFSFLQEYFDLLCSDLSSFPVARAVAASSAVPVLFNPVVLENHPGCSEQTGQWFRALDALPERSLQVAYLVEGLKSYAQKEQRRYIHLVDGGITDNLGLLAFHELVELSGGVKSFLNTYGGATSPRFVVVSVNASTRPEYSIEATNEIPPLENIVNSATDVQLHRTNAATLELFQKDMRNWSAELSTESLSVEPYFVEVGFDSVAKKKMQFFFNQIPTSFSLNKEQVDNLISVGRELLLGNAEFQRFLQDISGKMAER